MEMTMNTRIGLARLTALATFLVIGAATSAPAQSARNGPNWDAWLGCWQAAPPPLTASSASLPLVCVSRTSQPAAVEVSTLQGSTVVARDTIDASGQRHTISAQGCTGWQRAEWSADVRRVYLRSEVTCPGGLTRSGTGILAISPMGEWLDVQGVMAGGNSGVRVTRYHDAPSQRRDSLPGAANA